MLPPVRFIAWIYGMVRDFVWSNMVRSVAHGATTIFHVATSPSASSGGKLFGDTELRWPATLNDCGKKSTECGVERQPPVARNTTAAMQLWDLSEKLVQRWR